MSGNILQDPPIRVEFVDVNRYIQREWRNFLLTLQTTGQASPQILTPIVSVNTGTTAAVTTTPIPLPAVVQGWYRVNIYEVITVAGSISSSLHGTIGWTDAGLACTRTTAGITNGAPGANESYTFPIHVDANSPITYAFAYASNAANQMTYNYGVFVEAIGG